MKTVKQEMKGEWHINGVKVRENELHEPKIEAFEIPFAEYSVHPVGEALYQVGYECLVCGEGHMELMTGWSKEQVINIFKRKMDNYCPNCGARLKEVNE